MDSADASIHDYPSDEDPLTSPPQLDATTLGRLCERYGAHFTEETITKACKQRFNTRKQRVTGLSFSPTYKKSPHHPTCAVGIAVTSEVRGHKRHKSTRMQTASKTTRHRLSVTFFTTTIGTNDKGGNPRNDSVNAAFHRQCVLATAAAIPTIFAATFYVPDERFCGKLNNNSNNVDSYRNAWLILAVFDIFVLHPDLESICKYCVTITCATRLTSTSTEQVSSRRTQIVFLHEQSLIGIDIVHDVMEVDASMCHCIRTPHAPHWTRKCCA